MDSKLENMLTKLEKVETKLEALTKMLRDYKPLFHKVGGTYELVVRNELKHMKGAELTCMDWFGCITCFLEPLLVVPELLRESF